MAAWSCAPRRGACGNGRRAIPLSWARSAKAARDAEHGAVSTAATIVVFLQAQRLGWLKHSVVPAASAAASTRLNANMCSARDIGDNHCPRSSFHTHTHTPRMAGSGFITTHVHALMVTACRKGTARGERRPGTDWEQRLLCTSCPHPAARAPGARCSRSHTPQHRQQRIKTTRAFLQTAPGKLRRPLRHKK